MDKNGRVNNNSSKITKFILLPFDEYERRISQLSVEKQYIGSGTATDSSNLREQVLRNSINRKPSSVRAQINALSQLTSNSSWSGAATITNNNRKDEEEISTTAETTTENWEKHFVIKLLTSGQTGIRLERSKAILNSILLGRFHRITISTGTETFCVDGQDTGESLVEFLLNLQQTNKKLSNGQIQILKNVLHQVPPQLVTNKRAKDLLLSLSSSSSSSDPINPATSTTTTRSLSSSDNNNNNNSTTTTLRNRKRNQPDHDNNDIDDDDETTYQHGDHQSSQQLYRGGVRSSSKNWLTMFPK